MSESVPDRGDEPVQDIAPELAVEDNVVVDDAAEVKDDTLDIKVEAKVDDDDKERDAKGRFIPKDRFDEAVRKERAEKEVLAARVKEYEAREAQTQVSVDHAEAQKQVKDLIKQHTSMLADGELDKASDLMEQILELKEEMSARRTDSKAMAAKDQAKEEIRYDAMVARIEADYPQINPDAEEFDREVVRKVQAYMTGVMQTQRASPQAALREAVETILGAAKASAAKVPAEDLGMRRKEEAVKKAMDAKTRQPASTKAVGLDSDKMGGALDASAVMKMSWDEFVKLPDSKLSEMRGDFVS